jgi:APA family basic amino acid/polyamine antiporter
MYLLNPYKASSIFPPLLSSWSEFSIIGIFHPFADFNVKLTAIILIISLTWINSKGIKTGAGVSTAILLMVLAGVLIIIGFGLTSKQADIAGIFVMKTTDSSVVGFSSIFTNNALQHFGLTRAGHLLDM